MARQRAAALCLQHRLGLVAGARVDLMSPICLFGMSYALRHGEHVRVDVLFASFSERNKQLIEFITALLSMAVCVIVIWLSWSYVAYSWNIGEGSRQSRRHSGALSAQKPDPDRLRAAADAIASPDAIHRFLRLAESASDALQRTARDPDAGRVLRPAAGGHSGRADIGHRPVWCSAIIGFGPGAVQPAAEPHLRRRRPTTR